MNHAETLATTGAVMLEQAAAPLLPALTVLSEVMPQDKAGVRIVGQDGLGAMLASFADRHLAGLSGRPMRPVRAVLFDKDPACNWALNWHQDRTIVVRGRGNAPGFENWSVKAGLLHVEPPFSILSTMLTVRFHLDRVMEDSAPLLVAPGSHLLGRIPVAATPDVVRKYGTVTCLANAGDAWVYATPIVHASSASTAGTRRRVLQVDYSDSTLPPGLEWRGID